MDTILNDATQWGAEANKIEGNFKTIRTKLKDSIFVFAGSDLAVNTTYTDGYIDGNGNVVAHASYQYTDYINVAGQLTIIPSRLSTNASTNIVFYDINKVRLINYAGSAGNATLTVPVGAIYVRATIVKTSIYAIVLSGNDVDKNKTFNDSLPTDLKTLDLLQIGANIALNQPTYTTEYITTSGAIGTLTGVTTFRTDAISVFGIKKIVYKGQVPNSTAVAFYKSSVISVVNLVSIALNTGATNSEVTVPEGATHIAATSITTSALPFQLLISEIAYPKTYRELQQKIDEIETISLLPDIYKTPYLYQEFCKHIFNSAICIGDSITQGWRTTGVFLNESYPAYLAKMTGWSVDNAGTGGQTATGWWTNVFSTKTFADFDIAVICLGQNIGLTDTIVADTASGNYLTYADTQTGRYCSIIEGILLQNPDIKITLMKLSDSGTTWDVVSKIGLKYSLPVVSFKSNPIDDLTASAYHPHSDLVHFGTIGNLAIANVVYKTIVKSVYDNKAVYSTYKE